MSEVFLYMFPGMIYMWLFFIAQNPLVEIVQEGTDGTLGRILSTPAQLSEYLAAKMVRGFLLCMIAQVLLLGVTWVFFSIDWGHPGGVLLACACGNVAVIGLLSVVYALAKTQEQANALSAILILTSGLLGGSMFPYEGMPAALKAVSTFTPNRWSVIAFRTVIEDGAMQTYLQAIGILLMLGLVSAAIGFWFFRRRLSEGVR